ncbi:DUF2972 domain-containing protein, partial [Campylobacter jejuni]
MLGEVLIKADKTWYKGSGFKLKNDIEKAKKEFQIFREIFKEFDQISSSILQGLIDNKQLFLKKFLRIKNILKIHQDYKTILDNIFHNFNYFIQNFDLIEEWLLSDDFNERYKKGNHPYPSLLDPKKLNDENEKINYHNIPAELAWDMNLPLPDGYKFVYWCSHGTGGTAFANFLRFLNGGGIGTPIDDSNIVQIFKNIYDFSFVANFDFKYIALRNYHHHEKFYFLLPKIPGVHITRDPISMLKHHVTILRPYNKAKRYIKLNDNFNEICSSLVTIGGWSLDYNLSSLIQYYVDNGSTTFHDSQLKKALVNTQKHFIIDMDDIVGSKTFTTIEKMCNFLSINIPNVIDKTKFEKKAINNNVSLLPLTLNIYKNIDLFVTDESWISIVDSGVILWNNWLTPWKKAPEGYCINVTHYFFSEYEKKILKDIAFYIKKDFYDIFVNELEIKKEIKNRVTTLVDNINKQKQILENIKIKEVDIINFMKENKKLRLKCKKVFDEHLL